MSAKRNIRSRKRKRVVGVRAAPFIDRMNPAILSLHCCMWYRMAKLAGRGSKLTDLMGTPEYFAIEMAKGEPYGLAVDNWMVGILVSAPFCLS